MTRERQLTHGVLQLYILSDMLTACMYAVDPWCIQLLC